MKQTLGKTPIEIARDKGKFDIVNLMQEHIRKRSRSKLPQTALPEPARKIKASNRLIVHCSYIHFIPIAIITF